ncbi:uncharacterized protein LOC118457169 [Anopheles albimanus]|uniref:uncharacterized protein LOC118457169 n=1 Tax=Anopheles albimanus TaxID=7167 RepID=UPI00163F57A2|nr:uncharacterized protein LOC118457169 [Anopheles albimanus]
MLNCQPMEIYKDCISRQKGSFIVLNRLTLDEYRKDAVDAIEMEKYVVFAPRGRLLSFEEIWLKPFDWSVWIIIAIICFASYLMHCIAPKTIGNNLFLLALIGLEKRKLRLSGRLEKFIAAGLLVLFYLMTCAYETKIIAYMIDTPSEPDPKTIDDLRRRNITIVLDNKAMNRSIRQFKYDMIFEENYGASLYNFKNRAYVFNYALRDVVNVNTLNADPQTGKTQFMFLNEHIFTDISFFNFYDAPLIQRRFARFQRTIFEAGLRQHWRSTVVRYLKKYRILPYLNVSSGNQQNVVESETLWLIFGFMLVMWSLAMIVFLLEITFAQVVQRWLTPKRALEDSRG